MFPNFIGINEKFLNLNAVALIEDRTDELSGSVALVTTSDGAEIELSGTDADILFDRVELITRTTEDLIIKLQTAT